MNGAYAINGIEIWHVEYNGSKQLIGYIASEYEKISKTAEIASDKAFKFHEEKEALQKERDEYYNMLVEHGIIKKPRSQEEINDELFRMNEDLSKKLEMTLDALNKIVGGMNNDGHKQDTTGNVNDGNGNRQPKDK